MIRDAIRIKLGMFYQQLLRVKMLYLQAQAHHHDTGNGN